MHKVIIKNKTDSNYFPTQILIDEQPINAVSVNFNQSVDTVPTCEIEINALPDIEALADIQFQFTPATVRDAAKALRHNLLTNKSLYATFLASISSALKELPRESDLQDVAKKIADRIIGEE